MNLPGPFGDRPLLEDIVDGIKTNPCQTGFGPSVDQQPWAPQYEPYVPELALTPTPPYTPAPPPRPEPEPWTSPRYEDNLLTPESFQFFMDRVRDEEANPSGWPNPFD